jgi:hypothetical protein
MRMSDWEFYVDESGDFNVPATMAHTKPRVVCGIVVRANTRYEQAALRNELEHAFPYWSWPFHSTEFRDPIAHLIRWMAMDRPMDGLDETVSQSLCLLSRWLAEESLRDSVFRRLETTMHKLREGAGDRRVETGTSFRRKLTEFLELAEPTAYNRLAEYVQESAMRIMRTFAEFAGDREGFAVIGSPESAPSKAIEASMNKLPERTRVYYACLWGCLWRVGVLLHLRKGDQGHTVNLKALRRAHSPNQCVDEFAESMRASYTVERIKNVPLTANVGLSLNAGQSFPAFDRNTQALSVFSDWIANRMFTRFKLKGNPAMPATIKLAQRLRIPLAEPGARSVVAVGDSLRKEWTIRSKNLGSSVARGWPAVDETHSLPRWAADAHTAGLELISEGGL